MHQESSSFLSHLESNCKLITKKDSGSLEERVYMSNDDDAVKYYRVVIDTTGVFIYPINGTYSPEVDNISFQ